MPKTLENTGVPVFLRMCSQRFSPGTAGVPGTEHILGTTLGTTVENRRWKVNTPNYPFSFLIYDRTTLRKYIVNAKFLCYNIFIQNVEVLYGRFI